MTLAVTLDANILHDRFNSKRDLHESALKIFSLYERGEIEIFITTRIEIDIPDGPLREKVEKLDLPTVGTGFRLDVSTLDSKDNLTSIDEVSVSSDLMKSLFPGAGNSGSKHRNRLSDVDHLIGHKKSGNEVFITEDGPILRKRHELLSHYGIKVSSLSEFLSKFE